MPAAAKITGKMRIAFHLMAGLLCLLLLPQGIAASGTVDEVTDCLEENTPKVSSVQIVEFTATDRIGGRRISRAKIYGKRFAGDGLRRVLTHINKPPEMRGSAVLMIEREEGSPDVFLYSTEMRNVKRITAHGAGGSLFGTDFSYEDFARWQRLNQPGQTVRLEDSVVAERPVYVVETTPADEAESSYTRVVSFIDRETCVVLKTESYEKPDQLRKVSTADPEHVINEGGVWVATKLVMRDVRDETHTDVTVEDIEIDRELRDGMFSISQLQRLKD